MNNTIQLRHPHALTTATTTLNTLNENSPYGPYPFITAALAALTDGDLDGFFEYIEGASKFTLFHSTTITTASDQIRFAFGITD